GYLLGQLVGSILPTAVGIFGILALYAFLARTCGGRLPVAGLACSVLGSGFVLASLGAITYVIPALAQAYLHGDGAAMTIADSFFSWPRSAMLYPGLLVPAGAVLFALAAWRTRPIPRT